MSERPPGEAARDPSEALAARVRVSPRGSRGRPSETPSEAARGHVRGGGVRGWVPCWVCPELYVRWEPPVSQLCLVCVSRPQTQRQPNIRSELGHLPPDDVWIFGQSWATLWTASYRANASRIFGQSRAALVVAEPAVEPLVKVWPVATVTIDDW